MAIPALSSDPAEQRAACAKLKVLFVQIQQSRLDDRGYAYFDTLSIGMSDDLEAAVAEGSTLVRIGTAIFGQRPIAKA
jgi:uncharacterized pyridoxal phosphate-containing UPF0001 family protein